MARASVTWADLDWFKSGRHEDMLRKIGGERDTCPQPKLWYRALQETPLVQVKVVIVGQDPYHTYGMADGLAFSCRPDQKTLPPSLVNIFQEYTDDLHFPWPDSGDLSVWARRGVLLINSTPTTRAGQAGAHRLLGWSDFTGEVLDVLAARKPAPVFVLWGLDARTVFGSRTGQVVSSPHPSPLSARRGFFGSRPFSTSNALLRKSGQEPIDWRLP